MNPATLALAGLVPGRSGAGLVPGTVLSHPVYMRAGSTTYVIDKVIGSGTFGVVLQASVETTEEVVAIKRVLQDRRYKNRELQMMRMFHHPSIVELKSHFYGSGARPDEVYLNLVMEYVPDTISHTSREYLRRGQQFPIILIKLYMFQLCRALAYMHSFSACHRDIKPQNLLVDNSTGVLKLIDFGCAKILRPTEANVSYICSRYYRAPELVFGATIYTTAVDIWSMACVMAELFLGRPLFPGESGVDQLVEIIKVLGTPSSEQVAAMSKNYPAPKFPTIKPKPWAKVFKNPIPESAIDLLSRVLVYTPSARPTAIELCTHPFFDELTDPEVRLPSGKPLPRSLFNYTSEEIQYATQMGVKSKLPRFPPEVAATVTPAPPSPPSRGVTPAGAMKVESAAPAPPPPPAGTAGDPSSECSIGMTDNEAAELLVGKLPDSLPKQQIGMGSDGVSCNKIGNGDGDGK